MPDYTAMAAQAAAMIDTFGAPTTFARTTAGAYDPATGDVGNANETHPITVVVFDMDVRYVNGTSILSGDKQAFASALGEQPDVGDSIEWMGETLEVVAVKRLAPGAQAVLTELQLRG